MKTFVKKLFILTVTILFFQQLSIAQFSVDANIRNRFEMRDGYQKLVHQTDVPAVIIHQRTRLSFGYKSEFLKLKITPMDVRVWGDESIVSSSGVFGDDASLSLYEGFAEIALGKKHWISVGRQELKYDSERLLSIRNWNTNGMTYDALVLKLKFEKWNIHIGSSWNSKAATATNNYYPTNRIKSLNYVWANHQINDFLKISIMHLSSGVTQTDTTNTLNFRHTSGVYSTYQNKNLKIWGNAYYQYGLNQTGQKVSALLFDIDAGYKLGKLIPGIGFSYLSGNSKTGSDQKADHLYDLLYSTRHTYFGGMDYFSNIPSNTKQGGLSDIFTYLKFNINQKVSINETAHYFMLSQLNELTPNNKNLGFENDLVAKYKFSDWGALEFGYLFIIPTESLKTINNIADNNLGQFLYLQLIISPKLF
ncbi:MAG TPA: alginate export family protein [Prolixibacteraceae bacterium]|nr:alginate export family protein [Prolixibacteraceae bacterium]